MSKWRGRSCWCRFSYAGSWAMNERDSQERDQLIGCINSPNKIVLFTNPTHHIERKPASKWGCPSTGEPPKMVTYGYVLYLWKILSKMDDNWRYHLFQGVQIRVCAFCVFFPCGISPFAAPEIHRKSTISWKAPALMTGSGSRCSKTWKWKIIG